MLKVVHEEAEANATGGSASTGGSLLDEIVRDGARAMLAAALQAEVAAYVDVFADQLGQDGHPLVVRNGYHAPREVSTAAGTVPVRAPRVNDRRVEEATGERARFASAILPAWARKSPKVAEVLPLLYLPRPLDQRLRARVDRVPRGRGRAVGADDHPAHHGSGEEEARSFNQRSLAGVDYVYVWVEGIHLKVRLSQDKVCLLVMIGVRADGHQGTDRPGRRAPGVDRVVGRPAA